MTSYYRRILKKRFPNFNRKQTRDAVKEKLRDWYRSPRNPQTINHIIELHTERITEQIGILCLSEEKNDILMWSHYADSHRGICLEFDGYFEFFANTQEVKYPPLRPRINPFRQSPLEMMEAALLTKAEHWKYEKEWRQVQYCKGPGVYRFPPAALTGVILGAQISKDNQEKVLNWVEVRTHPVRLYRSSPCNMSFSLNIEEVSVVSLRK